MSTTHLQTVLASVATTRYHSGVGEVLKLTSLNRFPVLATRCQYWGEVSGLMSWRAGGSPCTVKSKASWVMATWGPFCGQTEWQSHMTENITLTLTPLASGNKLYLEILDWYRNCFLSKWSLSVISPQRLLHHHSPGDLTFQKLNFPFWGPSGSNSSSKLKYI